MPKATGDKRCSRRFFPAFVNSGLHRIQRAGSWTWRRLACVRSITLSGLAVFSILVLLPFVLWETTQYPSFTVMAISVPAYLEDLGYNPDVLARHMIDGIHHTGSDEDQVFSKIQQQFSELGPSVTLEIGPSVSEVFDVDSVSDTFNATLRNTLTESDIVLPELGISIKSIAEHLNVILFPRRTRATVRGEIIYDLSVNRIVLRLRINDKRLNDITISGPANTISMSQLLQEGAHEIIKNLDSLIAKDREARIHMLKLQGILYGGDDDLETAITKFTKALELDSKDVEAHRLLGTVLVRNGDHDNAIEKYKEAIKLRPDDTLAYHHLGIVLARFATSPGEYSESIATLKQAIELDPKDAKAHRLLGEVLVKCRPEDGIEKLLEAIELDPEDAKAYYRLGVSEASFGHNEEAIEWFKKAIEFDPEYVDAYISLGFALANIDKDHLRAIPQFKKAIELDPENAKVYRFWGYMLTRFADNGEANAEAIAKYKKAIELDPEDARAYRSWGDLLEKEQDHVGAAVKRAKAKAIDAKRGTADPVWDDSPCD